MNISGMALTVTEAGHGAVLFQPSHRADREVLHVVHWNQRGVGREEFFCNEAELQREYEC